MQPLELVRYPDARLRAPTREVSEEEFEKGEADGYPLSDLGRAMTGLMRAHSGVGLAGPQAGLGLRVFVALDGENPQVVFNPSLSARSEETEKGFEGCLSLPHVHAEIERPKTVRVEGRNSKGERIVFDAKGLFARVCQHEADHLDGVLFVDYVKNGYKELLREKIGLSEGRDPLASFISARRRIAWGLKGDEVLLVLTPPHMKLIVGKEVVRVDLGRKQAAGKAKKQQRPKRKKK